MGVTPCHTTAVLTDMDADTSSHLALAEERLLMPVDMESARSARTTQEDLLMEDANRPSDLPSSRDQLMSQSRETQPHTSQWDTRLRLTTTGRELSMINHLTTLDQLEDITGPSTTSTTPGTESSMLTEERDTPLSTSAKELDAQTVRIRLAPFSRTSSTDLEKTTARTAPMIGPAQHTTEKI